MGCGSGAAAPRPAGRRLAQSRAFGVGEDVGARRLQVALVFDQAHTEALLKQVADPIVPAVETLRVHEVEPVHPAREVLAGGFHDQVEVVVQHAERVEEPTEPPLRVADPANDRIAVEVVSDDGLPRDAADGYVDDAVRRKDGRTRPTGHCDDGSPPAHANRARGRKRH